VIAGADLAVFLDRDGVINEPVADPASGRSESPYRPEDVALTAGAVEALRLLRTLGVPLVVVSNQPSAAKGSTTIAELMRVHEAVMALLADAGVGVDDVRYCFHHPEGVHPDLGRPCDCRKPLPGLIRQAAAALGLDDAALGRSWLIGDSDVDMEAGRAAGCRTVLVEEPRSAHRRAGARADHRAPDVLEAARIVAAAVPAPVPGKEAG
jgi:D-glycero-D-manno-heptose 1,7-bisphosphate phosphatase